MRPPTAHTLRAKTVDGIVHLVADRAPIETVNGAWFVKAQCGERISLSRDYAPNDGVPECDKGCWPEDREGGAR